MLPVLATLAAGSLAAGHPVVPGFERFHADDEVPALEAGRLLLSELS
ncbi:MAG: hypothetical protein HKO57_12145, partial [Akkermansiaceae bacterium]|nr:hypothetical protein [Akkermansiaceae bacterium]